MKITHADMADAEEILKLQKLAYEREAMIYNDWSIPPLTQTLEEIKKEFHQHTFLKACESDKIIGSVRASVNNGNCEIGRLIVHPAFQSNGLGTRLMLAVESEFPMTKRLNCSPEAGACGTCTCMRSSVTKYSHGDSCQNSLSLFSWKSIRNDFREKAAASVSCHLIAINKEKR